VPDFDEIVERAKRTSSRAAILSLLLLGVVLSAVAYSVLQLRSLQSQKVDVAAQIKDLETQRDNLQTQRNGLQIEVNGLQKSLKDARDTVNNVVPVIKYFPKNLDEKRVEKLLQARGFAFTTGHGKEDLSNKPTSAIFFGQAVKLDAVKSVATALIKGGVTLLVIRPIQSKDPGKANMIEIGSTAHPGSNSPVTVERIQSAKTLAEFS